MLAAAAVAVLAHPCACGRRALHRHPQDPAHRRDHAGEPLVRLLLRHVPRRRRHPEARVRAGPAPRRLRPPVPQPAEQELRRAARPHRRDARHRGRAHERLRRERRVRPAPLLPPAHQLARVLAVAEEAGRDGLPRRRARSRTTGATRATSSSRTTCSSRRRRGACPRISISSRAGRRSARAPATRRAASTRSRRPGSPPGEPQNPTGATPDYAWTDLTYLLHRAHVSWRYYVFKGSQPDCEDGAMFCKQIKQNAKTPGIWNPLPWFDTVKQDGQRENVAPFEDFLTAARSGDAAGGLVDHARRRRQRASARARLEGPDVRDERDRRGDAQPRLEVDRDLPRVGRLGRLLRPREAAGRRPRTATACACRRS